MITALLVFTVFFLFLCFVALVVGVILLIVRKNKWPGAIMTSASAFLGIIFCGVFAVGIAFSGLSSDYSMMGNHSMMYDDLMDGSNYDDTNGEDDPYDGSEEYSEDEGYYADDYITYKVGQVAEFEDNVWINVTKLEKWPGDTDLDSPMAGYYVKATVTIENKGTRSATYYADDFLIYDNTGAEGDNAYKEDWREIVKPGTKVTKTVYFDVYGDGPFHVALYDVSWSGAVK